MELAPDSGEAAASRIAALAVVLPVFDQDRRFQGAVVAEAYASHLLAGLDPASPGFAGVTELVDGTGQYLYHSTRKRDWASVLASCDRILLDSEFDRDATRDTWDTDSNKLRAGLHESLPVPSSAPLRGSKPRFFGVWDLRR